MILWVCNSEHPPPFSFFSQVLLMSMTSHGVEYPFGQLRSAVPAVSPLVHPSLLAGGVLWETERPWLCLSTAQQSLKRNCVINTISSINPKNSPIQATLRNLTQWQPDVLAWLKADISYICIMYFRVFFTKYIPVN